VKPYRARHTPEAAERIWKLHPEIKREIKDGIRTLLDNPLAGYPLHSELSGYWSCRSRTYRIVYQINDDNTMLDGVLVGPSRNVYEELRVLLLG
jgi:mRNA-degrading endonuclease RelE of RelBE toxin-antitoxin system